MSVKLTEQQRRAVESRGASLIVSAAAGAGKTAVLVRRVLGLITDPQDPCGVDELLVVTFTNAAAGEMRQRMGDRLREELARRPEDSRLRRQLGLLGSARIQTVHAFCQSLIREHFTLCGVEPNFRLVDETQGALLLEQALNDALEEAYRRAEPGFNALCDALTDGRSDRQLSNTLLEIYHRTRSIPQPERLLQLLPKLCLADQGKLDWLEKMRENAEKLLSHGISDLKCAMELARDVEDVWEKYGPHLQGYLAFAQSLQSAILRPVWEGWDDCCALLQGFDKGRLPTCRYEDKAFLERVKAPRERFLKVLSALREEYFFQPLAAIRQEGAVMAPMIEAMCGLVLDLSERFSAEKQRRGLLDFSDLEHYTLRLLREPAVADDLRRQFKEVLVDEYQDTNAIQEEIFCALRGKDDQAFFVGDIKQSIYRFRLAEPALFGDRYARSKPYAPHAAGEVRLSLNRNFRSRPEVLSLCNAVMSRLMSRDFGDVEYDADQRLYPGREKTGTVPSEVLLLDCPPDPNVEESEARAVLEARLVAQRVARLLREETVPTADGGTRPARPEDVAILLSSFANKAPVFRAELQKLGIPCGQGGGEFFGTVETSVMLSLLRLLVNRRQDIPLVSLLRSPLYLMSPDLLARLRLLAPEGDLIDGLELAAKTEPLCARVLADLDRWQAESLELPLSRLVRLIYDDTGAESLFAILDNGPQRRRNLQRLEELCRPFDGGDAGLSAFLRWIDRKLQEGLQPDEPPQEAQGVQLMSIHRSKGLEWPFVVVPDLSKRFNTDDLKSPVLFHPNLGLGLQLRRQDTHGETRTQLQQAIAARTRQELKSEELRKLYVAMTRAREKLILVMSDKALVKKLAKVAEETGGAPTPQWLALQNDAMTWLMAALLTHPGCGAMRTLIPDVLPVADDSLAEDLICRVVSVEELDQKTPEISKEWTKTDENVAETDEYAPLLARSRAAYAHLAASRLPSKLTPTGLRALVPESGQVFGQPARAHARDHQPQPLEQPDKQALARGTAMHALLRRADLAACADEGAVLAQADRLLEQGFLSAEERSLVWPAPIVAFANSPLGRRAQSAQKLLQEYEFSVLLDAADLLEDGPAGEDILLNGAIDLLLFEPDGLTVIDFKTDRVAPGMEEAQAKEHALQLALYARAAREIFDLPVKECWVWFLRRGAGVKLDP